MFAITADQKSSRRDVDRAGTVRDEARRALRRAARPPGRPHLRRRGAGARRRRGHRARHRPAAHARRALERGARRRRGAHAAPRATREATEAGLHRGPGCRHRRQAQPDPVRPRGGGRGSVPRATDDDAPGGTSTGPTAGGLPGPAEVEALITLLLLTRDRRTPRAGTSSTAWRAAGPSATSRRRSGSPRRR
ncbi:hypothetical protein [Clavibacter tessellarius]|uniref:hypothetical protein n=1 Tax=Clavibacter tessellarius TaxID=31965 RepID=UPI0032432DB2